MQLRTARLCLDCDEVHDAPQCPICASETFSFMTRWVPAPERRVSPRSTTSPEAEIYRRLVVDPQPPPKGSRLLKGGVLGLTAVGLVGWLLRNRSDGKPSGEVKKERSQAGKR
jgi:hypothetical protein